MKSWIIPIAFSLRHQNLTYMKTWIIGGGVPRHHQSLSCLTYYVAKYFIFCYFIKVPLARKLLSISNFKLDKRLQKSGSGGRLHLVHMAPLRPACARRPLYQSSYLKCTTAPAAAPPIPLICSTAAETQLNWYTSARIHCQCLQEDFHRRFELSCHSLMVSEENFATTGFVPSYFGLQLSFDTRLELFYHRWWEC